MKIKKNKRTIMVFAVILTLMAEILSFTNVNAAISTGDMGAGFKQDIYITTDQLETLTSRDIIVSGNFLGSYCIDNLNYINENADDPTELEILVNERVTFNAADFASLKQQGVGMHLVNFTYYNEIIANLGLPGNDGTKSGIARVNIVEPGVTAYDPDFITTPVAAIHAQNFPLPLSDAANFDATKAKSLPDIAFKAWDTAIYPVPPLEPGKDLSSLVTVNQTDIDAINNATTTGVYKLRYSITYYNDLVLNKESVVFITDEQTVVDKEKNLVIFASNFSMDIEDAKSATHDSIKTLASPKVYNFKTGEELSNGSLEVDYTAVSNKANSIVPVESETIPATAKQSVSVKYTDPNGVEISTVVTATINYENLPVTPEEPGTGTDTDTDTGTDTGTGTNTDNTDSTNESTNKDATETGDTSPIMPLIMILFLSGIGVVIIEKKNWNKK